MEESIRLLLEKLLDENHGELDLETHDYFLFFQDGLFTVSIDEDSKELQIKVQLYATGQMKIVHTKESIRDYLDMS